MHLSSVVHLPQNRLQYVTGLPAGRLSAFHLSHTWTPSPLRWSPSWWVVTRSLPRRPPLSPSLCQQETIFCRISISPLPGGWAHCGPISCEFSGPLLPQTWWMQVIWVRNSWCDGKTWTGENGVCRYCCRGATEKVEGEQHSLYTREQSRHASFTMKM